MSTRTQRQSSLSSLSEAKQIVDGIPLLVFLKLFLDIARQPAAIDEEQDGHVILATREPHPKGDGPARPI